MEEFDFGGRRRNVIAPEEAANWFRVVKPDVAVTLTLLAKRRVQNDGPGYWLKGDEVEYDWAFDNLIHDLSRWHLGRAYRRYKKLVPNLAGLEGDGKVKRHHIHAALRCPAHADREDFKQSIYDFWMTYSPWAMDDVLIEPITDDWVGYITKEGSEALLLRSASF